MSLRLGRRSVALGFATAALGCSRRERTPAVALTPSSLPPVDGGVTQPPAPVTRLLEWRFDEPGALSPHVVIVMPEGAPASARFPVVIALHGRGEALKGPGAGPFGWPRDYALVRAYERLLAPPLTKADFEGFVTDEDLAQKNRDLAAQPFRGLVVVCPYLPDLNLTSDGDARAYGRFLVQRLLPRVRGELPVLRTREATGIDGISLGGAIALRVGLLNADVFGAVSGLQPAIQESQAQEWADLARLALGKRPGLKLRLLTSQGDYFKGAVTRAADAMRAAKVPHDFALVPGPHDYIFNRGPGSLELLLWHDRVLARA